MTSASGEASGRLAGKVALISGGARGQGAAIAERFCAEGARVLTGDLRDEEGAEVAKRIGPAATYVHLDVRSEADWDAAVERCLGEYGSIDVLINNAGIVQVGGVLTTSLAAYDEVVQTNQYGCFLGMKAVGPVMARQGSGSIVNTSSIAGMAGVNYVLAYAASKFAIRGMTRTAALELGPMGIRVNSVHPGTIDTPMIHDPIFGNVNQEDYAQAMPLGRIGRVGDIASLMVYLASDESSFCTGAEFVIDGGETTSARR